MKHTQNKPFFALEVGVLVTRLVGPVVARVRKRDADLARQMSKAASSIPLNVSEGGSRLGKDRRYHFSIAFGSARELQTAIRVGIAWGYISDAECADTLAAIDRECALLWGLTHKRKR